MDRYFPAAYDAVRVLGEGGMGKVWESIERGSGMRVALKLPSPRSGTENLLRFQREIRLQSQLTHHNILPILDFDADAEVPWFVAPLAVGNLDDTLPKVSTTQALALYMDVVRGISFAHRNRVLHRDVKPANVLVFESDNGDGMYAAVSDFGLGRNYTRDTPFQTETGVGFGTEGFAAPEQWLDLRSVDHRADIFSLGRLLEYVLSVVVPADSPLVRRLEYCIRTSTARNRNERYQSADELAADLRLALDRPTSLQRPVDTVLTMVQGLLESGVFDGPATRELAQFLLENRHDYRLMLSMLPRIPARLWAALARHHAAVLPAVLESYVEILESPLAVDSAMAAMRLLEEMLAVSPAPASTSSVSRRCCGWRSATRWASSATSCRAA
ncbi:serine/threonine-protein kinase [Actinoplanes sp. CA-030573]|uniref:serine/threonine-protein kinase n=1 Tax=Actinoplanes sp. CA-030573 TaxID=3239898 RepID=UPI003D8DFA34